VNQRIKQLGNQVKKLEKQIETEQPTLVNLDQALAKCDYNKPEDSKRAGELHAERNLIATRLERAEHELLELMLEIEQLEESLRTT
jgi:ATP-binding cassette subfamily F protein 3